MSAVPVGPEIGPARPQRGAAYDVVVSTPGLDLQDLDVQRDVLPLFAVTPGTNKIESFLGTGFLIAAGVLVTCWHCGRDALTDGYEVVAATKGASPGNYLVSPVRDFEQDPTGADLATGRIDLLATMGFSLASEPVPIGSDVWSYGYPLTRPPDEQRPHWSLEGRFFQGYVTRRFYHSDDRIPSYEIDMRAPAGISGAPVVAIPSRTVVGVLHGVNEVEMVEHFSRINPDTGEREPEVVRLESFALAHDTATLRELVGSATDGKPLHAFLATDS